LDRTTLVNKEKRAFKIPDAALRGILIGIGGVSLGLLFSLFFFKFYSYTFVSTTKETVERVVRATAVLGEGMGAMPWVVLLTVFAAFAGGAALFVLALRSRASVERLGKTVWYLLLYTAVVTGVFFLASVVYCLIRNDAVGDHAQYSPASFIPFVIALGLVLVHAVFVRVEVEEKRVTKEEKRAFFYRTELFIYGTVVAILSVVASLTNILKVTFAKPSYLDDIVINGADALTDYETLGESLQLVAFAVTAILIVMATLFAFSAAAYISRSRLFHRLALVEILVGTVCTFALAMLARYYQVVQELNERGLATWLEGLVSITSIKNSFEYEVESASMYFFVAVAAVCVVALVRRPYTKSQLAEAPAAAAHRGRPLPAPKPVSAETAPAVQANATVADPCPAFSELDAKRGMLDEALAEAKESAMSVTLPALVEYVVSYARRSRLHLFYTPHDIATFIAGLGATRLTILQGMSGTGKTSLPKIFAEALYGRCEIVEIESSWRDKNELLGYYNEFSRTYTPKKFTQALYRAALDPESITLIVLDEMNLSRIEYYFSDFLSLMENEEDKRQIKLLNVGLYRAGEDGMPVPYEALTDGHTLKIPPNVWFVGTANRDESTFEISDKVYDRAHTMNFNKRAPRVAVTGEPLSRAYISTEQFLSLLNEAKARGGFEAASDPLVKEVEALLSPYNISFGNRIANQIDAFVSIYCACFAPSDTVRRDAIETILLSKVVSKLEQKSVEDKEGLAAEFAKRGLQRCSEFVLRLSED